MSGLATIKIGIVVLTLLVHWNGHDIIYLSSGLVHILLPIWFVFHLSLLPGTGLLYGLPSFFGSNLCLWSLFAGQLSYTGLYSLSAMRALFTSD